MSNLKSIILFPSPLFVLIMLLTSVIVVAFVGPYFVYGQSSSSSNDNPSMSQKIGVKITSPKANQTVPIGELTIFGTSSDRPETNCQVYVDWNDAKPMQVVTGVGPAGPNDYSNWTFTYTQNYHLVSEGINELTSKISCYGNSGVSNVTTKYYSINVSGSTNPSSSNIPTTSNTANSNFTTGFHSTGYPPILPQYSNAGSNNSQYVNDKIANETPTKKTLKVDNSKHKPNNFQFKWYYGNGNVNSEDLHKYIHNLIKEKLDRVSQRLLD